jgi:DNA-binding MarR family transcriptional regulator
MADPRDEVWRAMTSLVHSNRDTWRRAVIERTGLPFSRFRMLSRLDGGPLSMKQLAAAATVDAPAATVAVTELEERGLVDRRIDPDNRRTKVVSLTEEGRRMLDSARAVEDPAPPAFTTLTDDEVVELSHLLQKLATQRDNEPTQRVYRPDQRV